MMGRLEVLYICRLAAHAHIIGGIYFRRQNRRKSSLLECIFDNMALYFECGININALLQTAFSAILPTGMSVAFCGISLDFL